VRTVGVPIMWVIGRSGGWGGRSQIAEKIRRGRLLFGTSRDRSRRKWRFACLATNKIETWRDYARAYYGYDSGWYFTNLSYQKKKETTETAFRGMSRVRHARVYAKDYWWPTVGVRLPPLDSLYTSVVKMKLNDKPNERLFLQSSYFRRRRWFNEIVSVTLSTRKESLRDRNWLTPVVLFVHPPCATGSKAVNHSR